MKFRRRKRTLDTLELTPLIDIIFQLLIFFLITTTFISSPGISIERPKAKHSGELAPSRLTIVIPKGLGNAVFFQGERLSYSQLREKLLEEYRRSPDAQIAIDADETVDHGTVVKIMDIVESVGFKRIGIVTSPAEETKNNR